MSERLTDSFPYHHIQSEAAEERVIADGLLCGSQSEAEEVKWHPRGSFRGFHALHDHRQRNEMYITVMIEAVR